MKRLFYVLGICLLLSCSNNSSGLSKDKEEIIVRDETTKLAHYYLWEKEFFHFINSDLWNLLRDFRDAPLHRWDFGDYMPSKANQAVINCRQFATEKARELPNSAFEQTYAQYMNKYYQPSKYQYVSDEERYLADIYYAVYENAEPSVCEIALYITGVFKSKTPMPNITSIQRLKNKEMGYYWEVGYDNGKIYRVRVVKMTNGSYGIIRY